nr:MAG TPA: Rad50 zinc hook motif [Caudoviricetes sp.]
MHTCDLCGRRVSSPVRAISLDVYRLFEQWRLSQSEAGE